MREHTDRIRASRYVHEFINDRTEIHVMPKTSTLTDVRTLRQKARQNIDDGSVTAGYSADRGVVLKLLNDSLATELVCVLRYRHHYFMARGIHSQSVAQEFLDHSNEEQGHADQIAERIVQLGGVPDFDPRGLTTRSHAEYVESDSLVGMIRENLVAERIAIDSYREIINYLSNDDPTTRRMMEGILAMEEEHADDITDLLFAQGEDGGRRPLYYKDEVPAESKAGQPMKSEGAGAGRKERH